MHGDGCEGMSPLLPAAGKVPSAFLSFQRGVLEVGHTPCAVGNHGLLAHVGSAGAWEFSIRLQA